MSATTGTVVDARDGTQYRVTRMPDGRMWGVTPLSYVTADSKLVNNNAANTALHGLLYRKADAVVNAPAGCVIPSRSTILAMLNSLGLGVVINDGPIPQAICVALLHADDGGSDAFGFGLRRSGRWFSGYREFGQLGWFYARDDVDVNTYTANIGLAPESSGFTNFNGALNWTTTRFIVTDESVIVFGTASPVTYSPPAGTYGTPQTVTLSTETAGASICYTIDGSEPTSGSPIYTAPLTISEATTVKAIAVASGLDDSAVSSAEYEFLPPVPPSIYPASGTLQGVQLVVIQGQGTIRYTVDGSEPTASSPIYTGPFRLSAPTTVKARAYISPLESSTATAILDIQGAVLQSVPSYRDRVLPYLLEQYKGDNP